MLRHYGATTTRVAGITMMVHYAILPIHYGGTTTDQVIMATYAAEHLATYAAVLHLTEGHHDEGIWSASVRDTLGVDRFDDSHRSPQFPKDVTGTLPWVHEP